jgi:hypothetical protein
MPLYKIYVCSSAMSGELVARLAYLKENMSSGAN